MDLIAEIHRVTDPTLLSVDCSECGTSVPSARFFQLSGVYGCLHCCAHRALAILDPEGTDHVSYREIEDASCILQTAAALLKIDRLKGFSGMRP